MGVINEKATAVLRLSSRRGSAIRMGSLEATEELVALGHVGEGIFLLGVSSGAGARPRSPVKRYGYRRAGVDTSEGMVERSI